MPAKAGIQDYLKTLDSRLRGNDDKGAFSTFYETINFEYVKKVRGCQAESPVLLKWRLWDSDGLKSLLTSTFDEPLGSELRAEGLILSRFIKGRKRSLSIQGKSGF